MYTITLSDGTKIDGLKLNGNNFVSTERITREMFAGKLGHVEISCDDIRYDDFELIGVHSNMELIGIQEDDGEYFFALRDIPAERLERIQDRADLEYLAMMTGVEL